MLKVTVEGVWEIKSELFQVDMVYDTSSLHRVKEIQVASCLSGIAEKSSSQEIETQSRTADLASQIWCG